jgi:hypothetical protein
MNNLTRYATEMHKQELHAFKKKLAVSTTNIQRHPSSTKKSLRQCGKLEELYANLYKLRKVEQQMGFGDPLL